MSLPRIFVLLLLLLPFFSVAQSNVFWMKIEGEIDPRSSRYVKLALEEAKEMKADAILVEIDTYGGRVAGWMMQTISVPPCWIALFLYLLM